MKINTAINNFIDKANNDKITSVHCNKFIGQVRNYIKFTEQEKEDLELETLAVTKRIKPLKLLLEMSGVYLSDTIQDETIEFLYDNLEEIKEKNPNISLFAILMRLQQMLDYTYLWAENYDIYRQVFSVKELKELQKEINERAKEDKVKRRAIS